ncbi:hypothetical protein EBZ39_16580, partial [bacterium]|nr:hypothetical protein [bacterium]
KKQLFFAAHTKTEIRNRKNCKNPKNIEKSAKISRKSPHFFGEKYFISYLYCKFIFRNKSQKLFSPDFLQIYFRSKIFVSYLYRKKIFFIFFVFTKNTKRGLLLFFGF